MKRTLYLSMVCLLSALLVVGQTGSRDLNPIEKQKLQLPELSGSQARNCKCLNFRLRKAESRYYVQVKT